MSEEKEGLDYNAVADKIGLVPNVRGKDNLFQGAMALGGGVVGAGAGLLGWGGLQATVIGGLVGFVVLGAIAGFVLMIVGLTRSKALDP